MQTYLAEIQWQVFRLSEHNHLDDYLEEILDNLAMLCRVDDFNVHGEFLSFDIIFEAESSERAEELAKTYTKDSFTAVLNGSQMMLVDVIVKELPTMPQPEISLIDEVQL